jgi:hypothetical protein
MDRKTSLLIHGPVNDLGDLLAIARSRGCEKLKTDKVTVYPQVYSIPDSDDFVVYVAPKGVCVQNSGKCTTDKMNIL